MPLKILLVNYHSVTRLFGSFQFTHGGFDGSVRVLMRLDGRVEHLPDVGRHRRHGSKRCKGGIALIDFAQDRDDPTGAFQLPESLARGVPPIYLIRGALRTPTGPPVLVLAPSSL